MEQYNYNFEVQSLLTHFAEAFNKVRIKRFTGDRYEKDVIKVPIQFAPKTHILNDLVGQADQIKLPAMVFTVTGQSRDNDRIKNKLEEIVYKQTDGNLINLKAIPWNIDLELSVLCRYQEDMDQIIENFSVQANPYIIFSWKEPKSGREIRTEVDWDGVIKYTYPGLENHGPKEPPFRIIATTNFTIKGYLYKTNLQPVYPICHINTDIIPTKQFYCNFFELSAATKDNEKLHYEIDGIPTIRYVSPYYLQKGKSPKITIQGSGFNDTLGVYLSGSNSDLYPLTTYQPNTAQNSFEGYLIDNFEQLSTQEISFSLPPASSIGFVDIIVVNKCGWGKLTEGANRCNRVENPYPIDNPEHYNWCVLQFPYLNGLIISNSLNGELISNCSGEDDIIVYTENDIDRDALIEKIKELMELGNITISELV